MTPSTTTSHNTGRVRIGCAYVAPHPHHDVDADRLQDWLLGNPRSLWAMPNWVRRIWAWL